MIVYFETSAFVKLLVGEEGTDQATRWWVGADAVVASSLLYAEARAAIAAARRGRRLPEDVADVAVVRLHELVAQVALVLPTRDVVWRAGTLAEVHGLRGYDAVHLASALAVGPEVSVVTADRALLGAARAEGLVAADPSE